MKYMNSVVIKLWLTILFIVTTVLIILSIALMSFFNAYLMSESGHNLKQQAEKVELVLMSRHDKNDAMNYVKELIENPAGLILITNDSDKNIKYDDPLKALMLNEINTNKKFVKVFKKDETVVQSIKVNYQGSKHEYILLGYPSQAFNNNSSAIFIYQDTNAISDAFNYIAIIIFLVALVLLILTTIFAFFLSTRITKPLIHLKHAAFKLARGERNEKIKVQSRDEIGELALAFNKMEEDISMNMNRIYSERNLRDRLINAMEDGVLSFNMHLEKQLQNPIAVKFLDDIDSHQIDELSQIVNEVMQYGDTIYHDMVAQEKHYVLIVSPVINRDLKQGNGAVVIIRDMTEERKLDQMKQMFIANVSHELRTPIQMLQGYTEAILDGIVTEKREVEEFLNIILDESKRLNRLVNELLNVARIDAGEQIMTIEPVDVVDLVNRTLMNFKQTMKENDIKLNVAFHHTSLALMDYDKMIQVLTNIIDNAVRYTVSGDNISVETKESDKHILITISDSGVGIAPEHIDNIFERFYKVDQARTRGKHGTGLGLFIVKSIIEAHNGTISVESALGVGTTFIIKIPKVDCSNTIA